MIRLRDAAASEVPHLAELHAEGFDDPWDAGAIGALLDGAGGFALLKDTAGFILCRSIAGEAEILTLVVSPRARRKGLGRALVEGAARKASQSGAAAMFLEVAEDNAAAIGLYRACGFEDAGRRAGYYQRPGGAADALVMRRTLNRGA